MRRPQEIALGEHAAYEWIQWMPPHRVQKKTIDPLLAELEAYFGSL